MSFTRDRDHAIVKMWRAGAPLPVVARYVGMTEPDCAAVIKRRMDRRPSLGLTLPGIMREADKLRHELRMNLSVERATELLSAATTPAVQAHLRTLSSPPCQTGPANGDAGGRAPFSEE